MAAENGSLKGTTVEKSDSKAAAAEAEMSQSAGDVGDWLGVDSGGPAPVQVTLVLGMAYPGVLPVPYLAVCHYYYVMNTKSEKFHGAHHRQQRGAWH